MANYYATARSNYFQVKDRAAFEAAMEPFDLSVEFETKVVPGNRYPRSFPEDQRNDLETAEYVCLLWNTGDTAGISQSYWDEDANDGEGDFADVDLLQLISTHLVEGSVAVFEEAGAEKFRYISAYALAVNHLGDVVSININEIYDRAAAAFGIPKEQITPAIY